MYSRDEINSGRIDRMDSRARPNERTDQFPYGCGGRLSSHSFQYLVSKYAAVVQQTCTTQTRNAARTSTQRRDRAVTSRRRPGGHCTLARTRVPRTTQIYLDADLALKDQALQKARPRSMREWPRPQASRAESIRHNSPSRGERCPQSKKLRPFPTSPRVRFTAVIPESRASATNLAEKGRFIGDNRLKTARTAGSSYDYRTDVLIRLEPDKANYAGRAGAAACASSPARIPLGH